MIFHRAQQPMNSEVLLNNDISIFHLKSKEAQLSVVLKVSLSLIPHPNIHLIIHFIVWGVFFQLLNLQ